jgi:hypothetical protein
MDQKELDLLLKSPDRLCFMNSLLSQYQFPEDFLIKTICYYDSWKCLRSQWDLSPYFCFRYLYDNDTDSADDWTDYNEILLYLLERKYSNEIINEEYIKAMKDRNIIKILS